MSERMPVDRGLSGQAALAGSLPELPHPTLGARALRGLVHFYRLFFSAWLGAGCRYVPSCSQYAIAALERHGAFGGSYLAAWRVLRCHPGCAGGRDEVPDHVPRPRLFAFGVARADADGHRASVGNSTPQPSSHPTATPGHPTPETLP